MKTVRKYALSGILLIACLQVNQLWGKEVVKQTYLYSVKGTDSLYLDRYYTEDSGTAGLTQSKPCMMFVFGGGFMTGSRDYFKYRPYFQHLAEQGYEVISIDYRLGLRKFYLRILEENAAAEKQKNNSTEEKKDEKKPKDEKINIVAFAGLLVNAIDMAVEDLFDATNFVLGKAEEWNIDSNKILSSGSSAGAITVLQGEYMICNDKKLAQKLPKEFNYAGVVSFAGAIFLQHEKMKWEKDPAPIQMFHGNADANVPYGKVGNRLGAFCGSEYISKELTKKQVPHYFYTKDNATHEMAITPAEDDLGEIDIFLEKLVMEKEPLIIITNVQQIGQPTKKKHFGILTYVRSNFR